MAELAWQSNNRGRHRRLEKTDSCPNQVVAARRGAQWVNRELLVTRAVLGPAAELPRWVKLACYIWIYKREL